MMNKTQKILVLTFLASVFFFQCNNVLADMCAKEKIYREDATCECPDDTKRCAKENAFYCRETCYCGQNVVFNSYTSSCECEKPYNTPCENEDGKYSCMIGCDSNSGWHPYPYVSGGNSGDGGGGKDPGEYTYTGEGLKNPIDMNNFSDLIDAIAMWLYNIGLLLAPLIFVIGGIMFITAHGNPSKIQTAKNLMLYTAIGILAIILARTIVDVLKGFIQ